MTHLYLIIASYIDPEGFTIEKYYKFLTMPNGSKHVNAIFSQLENNPENKKMLSNGYKFDAIQIIDVNQSESL